MSSRTLEPLRIGKFQSNTTALAKSLPDEVYDVCRYQHHLLELACSGQKAIAGKVFKGTEFRSSSPK